MQESIVFGGGCFWCTEAVFKMIRGVKSVTSGYSGGLLPNPTYEEVCSGETGHAECIKVDYDPAQVKLRDLLTVFFGSHDPTTLNRQGADMGTQYRSVIFFTDQSQVPVIQDYIEEIQKDIPDPIVTTIEPLKNFYPAEAYHQDFYENNPNQPYCRAVINPKLAKVKKQFKDLLKAQEK